MFNFKFLETALAITLCHYCYFKDGGNDSVIASISLETYIESDER